QRDCRNISGETFLGCPKRPRETSTPSRSRENPVLGGCVICFWVSR
ncbi:unnamed protein product, partial [Ectocarpus sp. 13 AM-2016]